MKRNSRQRAFRIEALEERSYLSAMAPASLAAARAADVSARAAARADRQAAAAARALIQRRPTPIQYIDQQYAKFVADYQSALVQYLDSLATQANGGTVQVSQPLISPSTQGSGVLVVANGSVFGTASATTPLGVTVFVNGAAQGAYVVTAVSGNALILQTSATSPTPVPSADIPAGAIVSASVPAPMDSTPTILPSFVQQRVAQMTQQIVTYFNRLPIKLPKSPTPPRTSTQRNSVQFFVNQTLQGGGPESLSTALLTLALPTTTGSSLQLYDQAFRATIDVNRETMIEGIRILFSGQTLASNQTPVIPGVTS